MSYSLVYDTENCEFPHYKNVPQRYAPCGAKHQLVTLCYSSAFKYF